jgi:alpha-1,2-mannosyltransferase
MVTSGGALDRASLDPLTDDPTVNQRASMRSRWYAALEIWAAVVVAAALWQIVGKLHLYQWDVIVYWWAGRAWAQGASPYGAIPGQPEYLHFVYPPLTAAVFVPLAGLSAGAAKAIWIALKLVAFWVTIRLWRRAVAVEPSVVPPLFFLTFAFGSAALVDFTAGNIAVFEQLLLWVGFAGLLAGRRWLFVAAVVLAAQFKLTPVFFLGLLLVIDERPRWGTFLTGSAFFIAIAGANVLFMPAQTSEFLHSVSALGERGWGDPSTLGVMQDLVDQLRGLRLPIPEATAYVLYLAAVVAVLGQTVRWWRARKARGELGGVVIVLVTLTVYALVMPRMKDYSYVALLPVAWYVLGGLTAVTASVAMLAVLVPRPLPQLKLWLPLVPQVYVYAPLLGAFVLWCILTGTAEEPVVTQAYASDLPDAPRDVPVNAS